MRAEYRDLDINKNWWRPWVQDSIRTASFIIWPWVYSFPSLMSSLSDVLPIK